MSRKKSGLENALQALKIGTTLHIPKSNIEFKEPKIEATLQKVPFSKQAHIQEPHSKASQDEVASREQLQFAHPEKEPSRFEVSQSGNAHHKAPQKEYPQNEGPEIDIATFETPPKQKTHFEVPQSVFSDLDDAHNEDLPIEEPDSEVSEFVESRYEIASEGTDHDQGYFKLAHSVFSNTKLRKLPGDGFRLFLWMSSRGWRYSTSQGYLRASVRYIAEKTGMSPATVSRGLKILRDVNLVKLCRTDFHDGNLWKVSSIAVGNHGIDPKPSKKKATHSEEAEKGQSGRSESESFSIKLSEQLPQNAGNIRSIKNLRTPTLSPEIPENLRDYFSELKPQRKREGEWQAFRELLQDYSKQDIADCLEYLTNFGIPGSGETCHSPMLYLAEAIPQVLGQVSRIRQRSETRKKQAEEGRRKAEEEAAEDRLFQQAKELFIQKFPTESEQITFVDEYVSKHFSGIRPPKNVAQNIAIMEWFRSLSDPRCTGKTG